MKFTIVALIAIMAPFIAALPVANANAEASEYFTAAELADTNPLTCCCCKPTRLTEPAVINKLLATAQKNAS